MESAATLEPASATAAEPARVDGTLPVCFGTLLHELGLLLPALLPSHLRPAATTTALPAPPGLIVHHDDPHLPTAAAAAAAAAPPSLLPLLLLLLLPLLDALLPKSASPAPPLHDDTPAASAALLLLLACTRGHLLRTLELEGSLLLYLAPPASRTPARPAPPRRSCETTPRGNGTGAIGLGVLHAGLHELGTALVAHYLRRGLRAALQRLIIAGRAPRPFLPPCAA